MATLFEDTFNRADGAPGNDWTVTAGTWDISSNQLRCHTAGAIIRRAVPAGAEYDLQVSVTSGPGQVWTSTKYFSVNLRSDLNYANAYQLLIGFGVEGTAYASINKIVAGSVTNLVSNRQFALTTGVHTFTFQAAGSLLNARIDGATVAACVDSTFISGGYVTIYCNTADITFIDTFTIYDAGSTQMYLSPTSVPPDTAGLALGLTGVGTSWSVGVPGSPVITASEGTITYQRVLSATSIGLIYTSPAYATRVTFTDPYNGRTAYLAVTSGTGAGGIGDFLNWGLYQFLQNLNDQLIELLNSSAQALWDGETLEEEESVLGWVRHIGLPPEGETLASLLVAILREVADTDQQEPTLRDAVVAAITAVNVISGSGANTIADVLSAISAIEPGGDSQAVLDAIADLAGQLTTAQTSLNIISSNDANSIADVESQITGLSNDVGLVAVDAEHAADTADSIASDATSNRNLILAAIGGSTGVEAALLVCTACLLVGEGATTATEVVDMVASVIGAGTNLATIAGIVLDWLTDHASAPLPALVSGMGDVINDIAAVSNALSGDVTTITDAISGSETDLASKIDGLEDKIDALAQALAELSGGGGKWPGLANVTLGTPVSITETMRIATTMEGFIYDVTSVTSGARIYNLGGKTSISGLAQASFESDNGDMETFQLLSFVKSVVVPKSMLTASACVLEWRPGTTGTVTPWVRAAS